MVSPDAIPRNDALDKVILGLFVPAVLNFLIIPLVGAVDVSWVGRLGTQGAPREGANRRFRARFG